MGQITVIIVLAVGLAMASVAAYWWNFQARANATPDTSTTTEAVETSDPPSENGHSSATAE